MLDWYLSWGPIAIAQGEHAVVCIKAHTSIFQDNRLQNQHQKLVQRHPLEINQTKSIRVFDVPYSNEDVR